MILLIVLVIFGEGCKKRIMKMPKKQNISTFSDSSQVKQTAISNESGNAHKISRLSASSTPKSRKETKILEPSNSKSTNIRNNQNQKSKSFDSQHQISNKVEGDKDKKDQGKENASTQREETVIDRLIGSTNGCSTIKNEKNCPERSEGTNFSGFFTVEKQQSQGKESSYKDIRNFIFQSYKSAYGTAKKPEPIIVRDNSSKVKRKLAYVFNEPENTPKKKYKSINISDVDLKNSNDFFLKLCTRESEKANDVFRLNHIFFKISCSLNSIKLYIEPGIFDGDEPVSIPIFKDRESTDILKKFNNVIYLYGNIKGGDMYEFIDTFDFCKFGDVSSISIFNAFSKDKKIYNPKAKNLTFRTGILYHNRLDRKYCSFSFFLFRSSHGSLFGFTKRHSLSKDNINSYFEPLYRKNNHEVPKSFNINRIDSNDYVKIDLPDKFRRYWDNNFRIPSGKFYIFDSTWIVGGMKKSLQYITI